MSAAHDNDASPTFVRQVDNLLDFLEGVRRDVELGMALERLGPGVVSVVCRGAEGYGRIALRDLLLDLVHCIGYSARGLVLSEWVAVQYVSVAHATVG